MVGEIFAIWGCIPEITRDCIDMTNAGSTYLGLIIGATLDSIINWWIYNRQKKIWDKQDDIQIKNFEENNELILQKVEHFEEKNEKLLKRF